MNESESQGSVGREMRRTGACHALGRHTVVPAAPCTVSHHQHHPSTRPATRSMYQANSEEEKRVLRVVPPVVQLDVERPEE